MVGWNIFQTTYMLITFSQKTVPPQKSPPPRMIGLLQICFKIFKTHEFLPPLLY